MTEYFTMVELPDVQMFKCPKRAATLRTTACADMWKSANYQRDAPERLDLCKNCALGAEHAGVKYVSLSPLRGVNICGRCQRNATRLIHRHLCVSCYNREREYLIGRNARGATPKMHPRLYPLELRILAGDLVETVRIERAVNSGELVVAALRDMSKQVTFGFRGVSTGLLQPELF